MNATVLKIRVDRVVKSVAAYIKKKTKSKGSFPTEESAFKVLYMATQEQQEKLNKTYI